MWQPMETTPESQTVVLWNPVVGVWTSKKEPSGSGRVVWPLHNWDGMVGTWYPEPYCWMLPEDPVLIPVASHEIPRVRFDAPTC